MEEILRPDEVAKFLKLSKITIYKLIKKGDLPFIKVGDSYRMRKSVLMGLVQSKK